MIQLSFREIGTGEYAGGCCIKRIEHKGDFAELWDACKDQTVGNWLAEEDGFYINVSMSGYGFTEKLNAKTLPEACKQFNHIIATITA